MNRPTRTSRRGGVYVAVLGISSLLAVVSIAGIAAARLNARVLVADADRAEARSLAVSAVELGRLLVAQEADWRAKRADGVWLTSGALGPSTMTLEASDPVDNDINNRPHDPLVLRGTGVYGDATQIVELSLAAAPAALPVLSYAVHAAGGVSVEIGAALGLGGGTLSSGATVTNSGTIDGNVRAVAVVGGTVTGTTTLLAIPPALPPQSAVDLYAGLAREISASDLSLTTLGPGLNPWGTPDPDGLYVVRTGGNFSIKDARIHGTLVVVCPGKEVKVTSAVLIEPARADYPALIIDGDALFDFTGGAGVLDEAALSTNFNPAGAPYLGESDADLADSYVSAIRGLVHVTGRVRVRGSSVIAGALVCGSSLTDALTVEGSPQVLHDPALVSAPPQGYAESVAFTPAPGGWRQVVR